MSKKIYVLDTNVLLHDPNALMSFAGAEIGIPSVVLEEVDKFKKEGTDRGRNAREVIRELDEFRQIGSLQQGVMLENGCLLRVLFLDISNLDIPIMLDKKDNIIILNALVLKNQGYHVVFISKDLNARVKADALGIETQDYLKEFVTPEEFYQGWVKVPVPAVQLKREIPPVLDELAKEKILEINQFVIVESQHNPVNNRVFRYLGGYDFKAVHVPYLHWSMQPKNPQQLMALDLLFDPAIEFITLFGPAGTGKTFLALIAGLHQVLVDDIYEKLLISRPVIPLGRDIGYLPGDIQEKLHIWMLPIFDNMEFIKHMVGSADHDEEESFDRRGKKKKRKEKKERTIFSVEELMHRGKLSMEAITYMRGRSIPYQFILIDESQNLTPHEVKTLVSRVGEGSKIILAGDPYQIDSPYLDFSSNGLVIASEKFKGQTLFGSVFLQTSERSLLSKLATELL